MKPVYTITKPVVIQSKAEQYCDRTNDRVYKKQYESNGKTFNTSKEHHKISFGKYLEIIPKFDSVYTTVGWVLELNLHQERTESLRSLPIRGTLLPTRYIPGNKPLLDQDDDMITSVSVCESVLGEHKAEVQHRNKTISVVC